MKYISIVVPIFNEEKSINTLFVNIKTINRELNSAVEFVLVNDGSTDLTKNIIENNLNENRNIKIKLINKERNCGYGSALKTGIRNASYENLMIIDCDDTYPINNIKKHLDFFLKNNIDMLIGDRSKSIIKKKISFLDPKFYGRIFIKFFAIFLIRKTINDLNSGYRFFKKRLIIDYFKILPDKFSFSSTSTMLFILNEYNVKFVEIEYYKRIGKSKIRPFYDFFNFLNLILSILIFIKPLKIFLPLFVIFFFSGSLLIILRIFFIKQFFLTGSVLIIISLIFLFIGYLFEFLIRINFNKDN
ncbi:glycosyltransferase family 2 protein [Candidatus Pelagibacter sp.]|nr:glycosyltransferase family 2 protein [Candidatus Pelagibacter sp.]